MRLAAEALAADRSSSTKFVFSLTLVTFFAGALLAETLFADLLFAGLLFAGLLFAGAFLADLFFAALADLTDFFTIIREGKHLGKENHPFVVRLFSKN